MPASIHFGISSELFFFLAAGPNAILPVAGLCQLSVLLVLLQPLPCLPNSLPPIPLPSWVAHRKGNCSQYRVTLGRADHRTILLQRKN